MPQYEETTTQAPTPMSDILAGAGHDTIVDRPAQENLDISAGQVMGHLFASGYWEPVDTTVYESLLSGDGTTTDFDLGHDSVDADSVQVLVGGAAVYDFQISRGTGTNGVDQISFASAPASATDNIEVNYQRTTAYPAGVLMEDLATGAGEHPTVPILQEGGAVYDKLTGVPDGYARGDLMGGVRLE